LPSEIPENIPSEQFDEYTYPTDYEEEAVSMTPEEYEAMRSLMRQSYAKRYGLGGAGRGALYGAMLGDDDPVGGALTGAAVGGGLGAMGGASEAADEAGTIQDFQGRGYGHLADRLRSRAERGIF
jgi:hypothetical protein